jgi:hypothetical protein
MTKPGAGKKTEDQAEKKSQSKFNPWSSMGPKNERDKAWNAGHSLDSKKITSALGYLDLKQICYCLAHALNKHIEFSQGFFFLGDLRDYHKMSQNSQISGASPNISSSNITRESDQKVPEG